MSGPAVRSRVLDLRRQVEAATRGRELLDQKREALQRELAKRQVVRDAVAARLRGELDEARALTREAAAECGRRALARAALAQGPPPRVDVGETSVVGVRLPRLRLEAAPLLISYGMEGTAASVDHAAAAHAALLPDLVAFAEAETAVSRLAEALARTARRLNALDVRVLPDLRREMRDLASALEEDERDEAVRRTAFVARTEQGV